MHEGKEDGERIERERERERNEEERERNGRRERK